MFLPLCRGAVSVFYRSSLQGGYMDDIKTFAKNEKQQILIQTIRIYSQDIRMEFGIEKYAMIVIKSEKRETVEGLEL